MSNSLSDEQKEFAKFLDRDFNQCFQQMRHYDGQALDIYKFSFTGYIAVVGVALALFKYGHEKGIDYSVPAATILMVAALMGLILFALVVRNRVYFVRVSRYVNEHRRHFLASKPLGFVNETNIYTSPNLPQFFSWRSSQTFVLYLMAILNAFLLGVAVAILCMSTCVEYLWPIVCGISLFGIQIVYVVLYLKSCEKKSSSTAAQGQG